MRSQRKSIDLAAANLSSLAPEIRVHDRDRYLATLFAPADRRDALFAIYAFDHEIAKVRHLVSEPLVGFIRLQWWRDALSGIESGHVLAHPVVQALDRAYRDLGLDVDLLETAIQAREQELEEAPPDDIAAFEQHLVRSNGGIVRASVILLGNGDPKVLAAADHLGQCLGLLESLRFLDRDRGDRRLWLPSSLLKEHGLCIDDQLADQDQPKIERLRETLTDCARGHLTEARKAHSIISRQQLPAFFPGTLAERRLLDIKRSDQDPFAPIRLIWRWLLGCF